jgi:tetratricopeptide (TPR) repeat protein
MCKPHVYFELLFIAATALQAGSRPALAEASCSTLDASAAFSSTLSLPPASSAPFVEIRAAIGQSHFEQAASLLARTPRGADQSLWRAMLLLHAGKTFASIRSLEEASHYKDNSMIETLLAVDYLLLNQRQLTEQSIKKALALEPGNKLALYLRGRFNFVTHNYSQAIEDFRSVLVTERDDYRSLFYIGFSEWRAGEAAEAAVYMRRALDNIECLKINFAMIPETLAQIELQNGELDKALGHADLALRMAIQSKDREGNSERASNILLLRGKIHSALGAQQEAIDDWRQALAVEPGFAECWYLLANIYRHRGETRLADEALTRFKALHEEL